MKIHLFLFALISCSTEQTERTVSSESSNSNLVDYSKTLLSFYRATNPIEGRIGFNVFLQLKNHHGKPVKINPEDVFINRLDGAEVPFTFTRVAKGKAYFAISLTARNSHEFINFSINRSRIQSPIKLSMRQPHATTSKIILKSRRSGKAIFRLHLLDAEKNPVQLDEAPDILFEGGLGTIVEARELKDFSWEFIFVHPEKSPPIEISVRAQGVHLPGLYRYSSAD